MTGTDDLPELFKPSFKRHKTGDIVNGVIWDEEVMHPQLKKTLPSRRPLHSGYENNDSEFGF